MAEASETQCWLEFSLVCQYMGDNQFRVLDDEYEQIIAMPNSMEMNTVNFATDPHFYSSNLLTF